MWETQLGMQAPQEPPPQPAADEHAVLGPNTNAYAPRKFQSTSTLCPCHIIACPDYNHPPRVRHVTAQCEFTASTCHHLSRVLQLPNMSSLHHCPIQLIMSPPGQVELGRGRASMW